MLCLSPGFDNPVTSKRKSDEKGTSESQEREMLWSGVDSAIQKK